VGGTDRVLVLEKGRRGGEQKEEKEEEKEEEQEGLRQGEEEGDEEKGWRGKLQRMGRRGLNGNKEKGGSKKMEELGDRVGDGMNGEMTVFYEEEDDESTEELLLLQRYREEAVLKMKMEASERNELRIRRRTGTSRNGGKQRQLPKDGGSRNSHDDDHDGDKASVVVVDTEITPADTARPTTATTTLQEEPTQTALKSYKWSNSLALFFRSNIWARRLLTRSMAVIPALVVSLTIGPKGIDRLLVMSQVTLSALLPFAVWPLVMFAGLEKFMKVRYVKRSEGGSNVEAGLGGATSGIAVIGSSEGTGVDAMGVDCDVVQEGPEAAGPSSTFNNNNNNNGKKTITLLDQVVYEDVSYASSMIVFGFSLLAAIFITGLNVYMLSQLKAEDFEQGK
jgi:hypothetical protein